MEGAAGFGTPVAVTGAMRLDGTSTPVPSRMWRVTCAAAGDWLSQSGRAAPEGPMQMIERYGPEFDPRTGNGGCEVWIPLAG